MKQVAVFIAALAVALPSFAQSAESRRTAWEIVQDMRRIITLMRPTGQGAPTEAELQNYEQNLAIILDTDVQKQYLCNLYGVAIMAEHAGYAIAPSQSDPPSIPASGSLDARMHMMARILLPSVVSGNVSVFRAGHTIGWECRTQRIEYVLHPELPYGSPEMQNEIACYNDRPTCVRVEEDWDDEEEWPEERFDSASVETPPPARVSPEPKEEPKAEAPFDLGWIKDVSRRELWSGILGDAGDGRLKDRLAGYEEILGSALSNQPETIETCAAKAGEIAQDTVDRFSPRPTNPHEPGTLDYKLSELANGLMTGTMTYGTPDFPGVQRLLSLECRYQIDYGSS